MRVLYVSNQRRFLGGAERSLYELLKNLDRSRVQPFFASVYEEEVCSAIRNLGIPFLKLSPFTFQKPYSLLPNTFSLIRFIRENHIDFIHNNQCVDVYYTLLAGKLARVPVIIHHRDSKYYRPDRLIMRFADVQISISSWQNRSFLNNQGILIHNGIELERFPDKPVGESFASDTVRVGILGRIAPIKGQDVFIQAAQEVLKYTQKAHFKIIGDIDGEGYPDFKASLRKMVEDNNLSPWIEFAGYIPDPVAALSQVDISVCASRRDAFGRVAIESMACFKPVIATANGGFLDIVTEETGILIPVDDPSALASAILRLINDADLRRRMGIAGRRRVEEHFTIQRTLEKIYFVYETHLKMG